MTRRMVFGYGAALLVALLMVTGGTLYSQNVPGDPGNGGKPAPQPVKKKSIPGKYCRQVTRPPERINMCLRTGPGPASDECVNYCVEVTRRGAYCDDSPNSTCNAVEETVKITAQVAECFRSYVTCRCQDDWQLKHVTIRVLKCGR